MQLDLFSPANQTQQALKDLELAKQKNRQNIPAWYGDGDLFNPPPKQTDIVEACNDKNRYERIQASC